MEFPNCRNAINDPNQCRLCMRVCEDNFLECIFSDKEYSIAHQIFECTSIRVTKQDNLTKICKNCASLLFMTTEFRNACFKTNRLLMEDFVILELGDWATNANQLMLKECENFIVRHKQQVDYLYSSIVTDSEQCLEGSLEIGTELFRSESQQAADQQAVEPTGRHQVVATRERIVPEEPDPEILMEITKFLEEQTPTAHENQLGRVQHDQQVASINNAKANHSPSPDNAIGRDKKSYKRYKITCHICGKQYDNWKLQTHLNEHGNIRPYACDHEGCSSSFTGLVLLNRHKKLWHTDYYYAACSVCGKKCKTQGIYQTHISYHEEPKLPCTVCGKLMRNKRAIWKHMKTHSNDRKHVCSICNKKFTIAYTLRVHMRIHTNDKPYPCGKCEKRFQYKCLLKSHYQKNHGEELSSNKTDPK
ncbi:fez family zinc finger protein 2-like [Anopheles ziemanni]|uniref:fez family zinc finger protein 2-like n=1 Tax=Anopheles coustani TaxID=139045 RepID=UPI002659D047|nr:fez family zinc finger protein 2-like [Anopheles coustani]XP_058175592.1 fez family zinc finger protein 2-like [Anopheles ziemanni]